MDTFRDFLKHFAVTIPVTVHGFLFLIAPAVKRGFLLAPDVKHVPAKAGIGGFFCTAGVSPATICTMLSGSHRVFEVDGLCWVAFKSRRDIR